ncbi:uncharacterized protein SPPG_01428 [Spizellomyces punctatus DAOM BR117]|uniref:Uncharacterized protein n=1 Tax=Spizellomyces punctatus (strain DAOM BR117) TaxID=645134 RepID=A0A0L0HSV0_SPIPD|nr:uncharacterized protein SPPG_01428 [Spizellomyces punctatus DAOM BR117]KND03980.1 hypothetical protein SPPG_01428 [Spizellomyces punctatus DAOM BR117]|eukprot:XP_016612019.1 hypothetical protein SPPG_01428 [Spizellomyces punctatus DAOM BR117]
MCDAQSIQWPWHTAPSSEQRRYATTLPILVASSPAENPFPSEADEARRHPLSKVIVCGGIAGAMADSSMHVLDTVKTRMQKDGTSGRTPQYNGTIQAMRSIHRFEGLPGLLGGFKAAATGSVLATLIYFATYEGFKRRLLDLGVNDSASYFLAGALGDAAASVVYVPSEVVKTRMQLQGRYNNPHSASPHNYKGDWHALRSIWERGGPKGLYYGWRATLARDVPFTACQFTIYELARSYMIKEFGNGDPSHLTVWHDIPPGALAGSLAGFITTPVDVIKTYLQTQSRPPSRNTFVDLSKVGTPPSSAPYYSGIGPALRGIYKTRGIRGLFSGAVPRMVWTGSQSTVMFLVYEWLLTRDWGGLFSS